jgi:hypothetical protein
VLALVGILVFPVVIVANLAYQRLRLAADDAGAAAARRGQRDRPRVVRRRDGDQDAGSRGEETARFAERAHELRDVNVRAGRSARRSTRSWPRCPESGAHRARGRRLPGESGATDPGDVVTVAYLLTIVSFPIRSIGWLLGEFPRSVVATAG